MSQTHVFEPESTAASKVVNQLTQINSAISNMIGVQVGSNLDILVKAQEAGVKPQMILLYMESHKLNRTSLDWVINAKTLSRRIKNDELLNSAETDRFIRVARLTALAETVFGNIEKAQTFLAKPRERWNGKNGSELMQTDNGGRMVEELLQQLNHGFFA